ncbi:MAG: capsular biosynthesis protein [Arcobacter sp.]|nr:MAG: capsular biosynthesis protein [Arcobacter sp.]
MEKQQAFSQNNNDEIDLKQVFKTITKYKFIILILALIFTIGSAVFAYVKPSVYFSTATIEVQEEKKGFNSSALKEAFTGAGVNVENEMEVFKSRFLANRAASYLNLGTRYFTVHNFRKEEFYQNSPFVVSQKFLDNMIYGKTFNLIPIDKNSFRLVIEARSKWSKDGILDELGVKPFKAVDLFSYDKVHKYNEEISTEWFNITVQKISKYENSEYQFSFVHKSSFPNYFKTLSISQVSEFASVLRVNIQDSVSMRARDLINALFTAYKEQEKERKSEVANLSLDFIDAQLDEINKRLKTSEGKLENYKEVNEVINLSEKATNTSKKLTEYETQIQELSIEENILENLQQYILSNHNLSGLTVGSVNFADPSIAALVKKLTDLSTQRESLLIDYTELHPDIEKMSKTIASYKRSIKTALKNNLRQIGQRKASLKSLINKYTKSLETLPKQEKELTRLTRHFAVNEKVYSFLLEKRAETAILKSSTISNARILDSAIIYPIPVKPKRMLIVLVGMILGIILGLAYAFIKEFLNDTVKNTDEIERYSSIPIYGVVPLNKNKKTQNIFLEAFRSIRTNLQFLPQNVSSRVITITSSVSGEGKTTIVAKLAEIIAQTEKKVVVLDLDMRKASVHKEFDVDNILGLSNYLTGQKTLEEVIAKTEQENVDLITTGPLPPNPSELILTENMKTLIEELKEKYEYIIIDTPPVGLVTDALILMNYADISFVLVRANYTRKEFIKNLDRLAKEHSHNHIGMILNGVEIGEKYGYGYGVSYGYGYGNDKYYKDRP